jgi:hypothetical protein
MTLLKLAASVNDTVGPLLESFQWRAQAPWPNKSNLGNLGISVILLSALRVSGFGMNFLRVSVLFYCFCCYF